MTDEFQTVSILGLGYIGLPTGVLLASRGMRVIGVDINQIHLAPGHVLTDANPLEAEVKRTMIERAREGAYDDLADPDVMAGAWR
jgi:UDP-N-acetyl-D-mannosaminuronate dehydrogenase